MSGASLSVVVALALLGCADRTPPVVIFAAASTGATVEALAARWQRRTGQRVVVSAGASSTLARQIAAGAPAHLFLSADPRWIAEGVPSTTLLHNQLILIGRAGGPSASPGDPPLAERFTGPLALADPAHVPAGRYAVEALRANGWWAGLAGRLRTAPDVRGATRLVRLGEAAVGIVYRSELGPGVVSLGRIPEQPPIAYPLAVLPGAPQAAEGFAGYLRGAEAAGAFAAAGFSPVEEGVGPRPEPVEGVDVRGVVWLSLGVALLAMLLALPVGVALGWLFARRRFPGQLLLDAVVHLPLVLPPVVVGYGLLLLLGRQGLLPTGLAFTRGAAILAAAVMALPLVVRSARVAFELVDPRLEAAAATLGASPWRVWRTITLPLAASGVVTGAMLGFARSLGEFGATMVFAGNLTGETRTVPLAIYTALQTPDGERAALLLSAVAVALSMLALGLSEWHLRRMRSAR